MEALSEITPQQPRDNHESTISLSALQFIRAHPRKRRRPEVEQNYHMWPLCAGLSPLCREILMWTLASKATKNFKVVLQRGTQIKGPSEHRTLRGYTSHTGMQPSLLRGTTWCCQLLGDHLGELQQFSPGPYSRQAPFRSLLHQDLNMGYKELHKHLFTATCP